jgi:site-specific recombinase XerD
MEVVYIFIEFGVTRIPFFDNDRQLYPLLTSVGGGEWDDKRQEFIFTGKVNPDHFRRISLYVPYVLVEENSSRPRYFFKNGKNCYTTAPEGNSSAISSSKPHSIKSNFCETLPDTTDALFSIPEPIPEKFPEHWQDKLETELRSRKYSPRTRRCYVYYNKLMCRTLQKPPEEIGPDDITQFLAVMEKNKESSASAMNLAISALKFFYNNVMKNKSVTERHRPRDDGRLPMVLSKDEVARMLTMEKNPKHRLLLMLVYSSGLRVSEVVALKKEHIDLSRKVILVRLGKGRKDRCTVLSEKAARFIEEYCSFYNVKTWLFPGQYAARPLTIRSAQHIFDKAIRCAGIAKKVSIHSLRHSFATHLLESGTDIRYIQTLLGHANIRTTERYTHIARRSVLNIKSPLDTMF